jgi:hypothetical protein
MRRPCLENGTVFQINTHKKGAANILFGPMPEPHEHDAAPPLLEDSTGFFCRLIIPKSFTDLSVKEQENNIEWGQTASEAGE